MNYEFTDFSGGMSTEKSASEIATNQVESARGCDFRTPGIVRGMWSVEDVYVDSTFDQIYITSIFGEEEKFIRRGGELWRNERCILTGQVDQTWSFREFSEHLIICTGEKNWKYRDAGFEAGMCYCFQQFWEKEITEAIVTEGACGCAFRSSLTYVTSFNWEKEQLEGETEFTEAVDCITASSDGTQLHFLPTEIGFDSPPEQPQRTCCYLWETTQEEPTFLSEVLFDQDPYTWTVREVVNTLIAYNPSPTVLLTMTTDNDAQAANAVTLFKADRNVVIENMRVVLRLTPSILILASGTVAQHLYCSVNAYPWGAATIQIPFVRIAGIYTIGYLDVSGWHWINTTTMPAGDLIFDFYVSQGTLIYSAKIETPYAGTITICSSVAINKATLSSEYLEASFHLATSPSGYEHVAYLLPGSYYQEIDVADARESLLLTEDTTIGKSFDGSIYSVMFVHEKALIEQQEAVTGRELAMKAPIVETGVITDTSGDLASPVARYYVSFGNSLFYSPYSYLCSGFGLGTALWKVPLSSDPKVSKRWIWRFPIDSSVPRLVGTIDNNSETMFTDEVADALLGEIYEAEHDKPPAAVDVQEHLGKLYYLISPNLLYWPERSWDWEYLPATNYEALGNGSNPILALLPLGYELCAYNQIAVWKFLGSVEEEYVKRRSHSSRGVLNSSCLASEGQLHFFLDSGANGIFAFDSIRDIRMSVGIQQCFLPQSDATLKVDVNDPQYWSLCFTDGKLFFCADETYVFIYLTAYKHWTELGTDFRSIAVNPVTGHIFGMKADTVQRLRELGYEGATNIGWSLKTKEYAREFGELMRRKSFGKIKFSLNPKGGVITISSYIDGVLDQSWSYSSAGEVVVIQRSKVETTGYKFRLEIAGTEDSEFYGFALDVKPHKE